MNRNIERREFLAGTTGLFASSGIMATTQSGQAPENPICIFSKHFQWAEIGEAADRSAELGFDGIDVTVRAGGHVLPERVQEDLPKAAERIRKAGLKIPMVTTDIVDASSPHAEAVLKTMSFLGIRRYRWGGFRYKDTGSLPDQLSEFKLRVRDLASLNQKYSVCAMYHTHSGIGQVGASMWDLYLLLKDFSADAVAVNYDIGHAVAEGGYGGWIHSTRLLLPYMKGTAIKDFKWKLNAQGTWVPGWCPLGDGMVNLRKYLKMIREGKFSGPVQLHFEYPELGGADSGKKQLSIPKDQVLGFFRKDIDRFKEMLREAQGAGS